MEFQEVKFKNPVWVLQVFKIINLYGKDKKSFDDRREDLMWKPIVSSSGYVKEGGLFLTHTVLEIPKFLNCQLISLEDDMNLSKDDVKNRCMQLHHPEILDIFQIRMAAELELHLKYGYFEVGAPSRNDFKICDLKEKTPVEIKINGKIDSSLASGRARLFKEQLYIFELMGKFDSCKIIKGSSATYIKNVPEERKTIDLLKPLW